MKECFRNKTLRNIEIKNKHLQTLVHLYYGSFEIIRGNRGVQACWETEELQLWLEMKVITDVAKEKCKEKRNEKNEKDREWRLLGIRV